MTEQERFIDGDRRIQRYEYDDTPVLAVDLGPGTGGSVDVVDGTAIVVVDDGQYEFEVPEGAKAFIRNGVVTIEATE
jgi:hypothetical protein